MPSEYAVKAAFLYNFTKFVDWPETAFASDTSPFVICVLGTDPFNGALDAVEGKPVGPRRITLRHPATVEQAGACQLVFVTSESEADRRNKLQQLRGKAMLTVGDSPGFASHGGAIGFVLADGHVRFEINPQAAVLAHLSIQSALLRLATIVKDGE